MTAKGEASAAANTWRRKCTALEQQQVTTATVPAMLVAKCNTYLHFIRARVKGKDREQLDEHVQTIAQLREDLDELKHDVGARMTSCHLCRSRVLVHARLFFL